MVFNIKSVLFQKRETTIQRLFSEILYVKALESIYQRSSYQFFCAAFCQILHSVNAAFHSHCFVGSHEINLFPEGCRGSVSLSGVGFTASLEFCVPFLRPALAPSWRLLKNTSRKATLVLRKTFSLMPLLERLSLPANHLWHADTPDLLPADTGHLITAPMGLPGTRAGSPAPAGTLSWTLWYHVILRGKDRRLLPSVWRYHLLQKKIIGESYLAHETMAFMYFDIQMLWARHTIDPTTDGCCQVQDFGACFAKLSNLALKVNEFTLQSGYFVTFSLCWLLILFPMCDNIFSIMLGWDQTKVLKSFRTHTEQTALHAGL